MDGKLLLAYNKTQDEIIAIIKFDRFSAYSNTVELESWINEKNYYVGSEIIVRSEEENTRTLKSHWRRLLSDMTGMTLEERQEYLAKAC